VLWRQDGRQRSLTFENLPAAERFKTLLEDHGPEEALRIIEIDEIGRHVPTVTQWLTTHVDNLTGIQPATISRYRTYVAPDVDPVFGSMPITAVTETAIARWVKQLGGSGKTISNKHGFLSGAFNAAVRAGVQPLPRPTPAEYPRRGDGVLDTTGVHPAARPHREATVDEPGHLAGHHRDALLGGHRPDRC
jgi:hypothetical protein